MKKLLLTLSILFMSFTLIGCRQETKSAFDWCLSSVMENWTSADGDTFEYTYQETKPIVTYNYSSLYKTKTYIINCYETIKCQVWHSSIVYSGNDYTSISKDKIVNIFTYKIYENRYCLV